MVDPVEDATETLSRLVQRWSESEAAAMERLYRDYFPRLRALSRRTLGQFPGAGAEADDVVQSAFKSLCRFMRSQPDDSARHRDDLWRILCQIVACKSRRRVTRQTRGLRGGRVHPVTDLAAASGEDPLAALWQTVTPVEFDICLEEALEQLSPSLRKIALLTIEGQTQADIAARLNCSRRTIIRKLELIRETLAGCLD